MSAYDQVNVDYKSYNMSRLGKTRKDPEESPYVSAEINSYDIRLLQRAKNYWDAMYDFRQRRKRNRMYHRGDQWKDVIFDAESGGWMYEEEYIKSQGKQPLKQNQIRQLVKNLEGQFRSDTSKAAVLSRKRNDATTAEMLTNTLQYALDMNKTKVIDVRAFEEFLLSGAVFQKTRYQYMPKFSRQDLFLENRPTAQVFVNDNIKDPRLTDMDFIGEFYDLL
jgi:hypothetical protein